MTTATDAAPESVPLACPECGRDMRLRHSQFGLFYGCTGYPACRCVHGAHADGTPLGVPADLETRKARMRLHEAFDGLWKWSGPFTRKEAYAILQDVTGLSVDDCHIAKFDRERCERTLLWLILLGLA